MKIVTLATQKGGSAKTTICRHLAVAAHLQGFQTAILDTDQQGGARDWGEARQGEPPRVVVELSPNPKYLEDSLERLRREGTQIVFVDTPGSLSGAVAVNAIHVADLILVPVRPTADDLNALPPLLRILGNRRYRVILSQVPTNTPRPRQEVMAYLEGQRIPVLETPIHLKSVIPETLITGKTVLELTGLSEAEQKSVREFEAVFQWVRSDLRLDQKVAA